MSGLRLTLGLLPVLLALCGCQSLGHQCAAATAAGVDHSPCAWAGIYPTVVTPFSCDGIDVASLEAQLRHELAGGVHGLLVLGTIGEGEYANEAERAEVIRTAVRVAAGCKPVVAGIHTCDLGVAQSQLHQARQLGAAAVLVKYAGNPRACPGEVLGFMAALSDMKALPIFYYHYPSQTGLKLSARDVADILLLPGVVGIKESTGSLDQASQIATCSNLTVLSGDDSLTLPLMSIGGRGVVSVVGNIVPRDMKALVKAYDAGKVREALDWHKKLFPLCRDMLGVATNPIPLKAAMKLLGRDSGALRLPLCALDAASEERVRQTLVNYGLLK